MPFRKGRYTLQQMNNVPVCLYINTQTQENQELKFLNAMKTAHKQANKEVLKFYESQKETILKADRVKQCADFALFKHYILPDEYKLEKLNLCHDRLCLNCQLSESRKLIRKLIFAVEHIQIKPGETLQFLTLTAPNVSADKIREQTQNLVKASKAFLRKYNIKDYFRSVEITYNKKQQKEKQFHPHLHFIFIAPKNTDFPLYDKKLGKYGANPLQFAWAQKWTEITGQKPETNGTNKKTGEKGAYLAATVFQVIDKKSIFELTKYITKPQDMKKTVIAALYGKNYDNMTNTGISGLRLKTPCGQFKELFYRYKMCKALDDELEKQRLEGLDYELLQYIYNGENYERWKR